MMWTRCHASSGRRIACAFVMAAGVGMAGGGCAQLFDGGEGGDQANLAATVPGQGLALTVDYLANTGAGAFQFDLRAVDCPPATGAVGPSNNPVVDSAATDLEDGLLAGDHPSSVFDAAAGHLFADHFFTVAAGCYHITATPLPSPGVVSTSCQPAWTEAEVFDGTTTEVLLVSQCDGEVRGGLDVLGALNHPPVVLAVTQEAPGKFIFQCEGAEICVDVADPDSDPLEVQFNFLGVDGGGTPASVDVAVLENGSGSVCFTYHSAAIGAHALEVLIYDLLDSDGNGVPELSDQRVEDYLALNYTPAPPSNDSLVFPLYVQPPVLCDDNDTPRLLDRGLFVAGCVQDVPSIPHVLPPCPPEANLPLLTCTSEFPECGPVCCNFGEQCDDPLQGLCGPAAPTCGGTLTDSCDPGGLPCCDGVCSGSVALCAPPP